MLPVMMNIIMINQLVGVLQRTPIYVFGESYGGKMAAHFANRLYHVRNCGWFHSEDCNFIIIFLIFFCTLGSIDPEG